MKNANFARFCRKYSIPVIGMDIGNTHIPWLMGEDVSFWLFDGFALGIYKSDSTYYFLKMTYPMLRTIENNENLLDYIQDYRYGGQVERNYYPELSDSAITFGHAHWVMPEDFTYSLQTGLLQMGHMFKRLEIFRDEQEFLSRLDGQIYCVAGRDGAALCDLHQDEYLRFLDEGKIINHLQNPEIPAPPGNCSDTFVAEGADPDEIYRSRIEIIIL